MILSWKTYFGFLILMNLILFSFNIPTNIYHLFFATLEKKYFLVQFVSLGIGIGSYLFSYYAYAHRIKREAIEGHPGYKNSEEKEIFILMSKPVAYSIQIILLIFQITFAISLYLV